jgi:L-gulono-1,4-lactone dehydrogenase
VHRNRFPFTNFGGNVSFQPQYVETPRSEQAVLEALKSHTGKRIRAIGRLHSWSEAAQGEEVIFDLRHLNEVRVERRDGEVWAIIGAGCQIKRAVAELERLGGVTLPSLGLIDEQSLAGAMATGTHGSGRHSLSHYAQEVRIASLDALTGEPVIRSVVDGLDLKAARCSLGCMGIILSIALPVRSAYRIEEHFRRHQTLDHVLAEEAGSPLQQFFLIPWNWSYFAQHRREVSARRSGLAWLYRIYFLLTFDFGLHLTLLPLVRWLHSRKLLKLFYSRILPWTVIRDWRVVDESYRMLVMEHERFVHIELEIFVRRAVLQDTLLFLKALIRHCDGEADALEPAWRVRLPAGVSSESLEELCGSYTHHYPICIRRVLPDDTLISMSSGDGDDWYAISLISLASPSARKPFEAFATCLATWTAVHFDARPHWGKYQPLDSAAIARLYEHLPQFRACCERFDPQQQFRNDWVDRVVFDRED